MCKGTARLEHAVGQDTLVPPREGWPEPPARTEAGDLLTDVIMATFRLNGRLLDVAQRLAAKGEITAPWWQVLGGVLDAPRGVAAIARRMGLTRQGVQRVADILVKRGLAEYLPNPGHRRAKLIACTEAGHWAIRKIALAQRPWADRIASQIGPEELRQTRATMQRLIGVLEAEAATNASEFAIAHAEGRP
jgi:DNA-binding MarR family transcriptional regulator